MYERKYITGITIKDDKDLLAAFEDTGTNEDRNVLVLRFKNYKNLFINFYI